MVSKLQQTKATCGYTHSPVLPVCGTCAHFRSEMQPVAWMAQDIATKGEVSVYGVGVFKRVEDLPDNLRKETGLRCGLLGFAVKKMGACKTSWVPRP
ncbi:MAG: hypothetical protein Q7V53_02950 [Caldisericota bacterium]|nr:hypothetical protein [Caldisericota bacterium]